MIPKGFKRVLPAILAAIAAHLWVLPGTASAGPAKSFRDWHVWCSDALTCNMEPGFSSDRIYGLRLSRSPQAGSPVVLELTLAGEVAPGLPLSFTVPGEADGLTLPGEAGESGVWRSADPAIAAQLVPAMRNGSMLVVTGAIEGRQESVSIPLSGSAAAMLFVDEVQDRVDKRDALVAIGPGAPTGRVSRARDLAGMDDLPQAVRALYEGKAMGCTEFEERDLIASFGGTMVDLGEEQKASLYFLPCGGPGAYNLVFAGFLHDRERDIARIIAFPTMGNKGPTVTDMVFNISWDDTTSQLSAFFKGRGLGDCGGQSTWEWNEGGGYGAFTLVEERVKEDCDGNYDEFPLVWPVR